MEYILKVSPKGQVILPKKLRERLKVKELILIEAKDEEGIIKKPELSSEKLAGCFKKYVSRKKIPINKAIDKATEMVAHEIARKNH
ncbi:MAG: AbrB/MazE/SpoVT family DNA-binding domain-containing protein [Nitrospira sp.]|nr:AbrB/MazE/SpoVT family DNA-binding domain-containing protein [Nitrospira sp.]